MKNAGIVMIVLGAIMMMITGFNYVTSKKVVDLGPIEINKEETHPVQWSPVIGAILIVGGVVVMATNGKKG